MIEDELLKWKFKQGSTEALSCIYRKYLDDLLALAAGLSGDANEAEDIVQDVFVSFAKLADSFKLRGSLKGYLAISVVNRVRDRMRRRRTELTQQDRHESDFDLRAPEQSVILSEEWQRVIRAMDKLPYQQREAVLLRVKSELKFKEIARAQGVSVGTAITRYKCGLNRLRSSLNGEVEK
ncbi:MAG: RNA polymerase sigma factor [Planctomycetota bacterium]|jgi:RNA polymerase sigma-70 factor (ECF subfamily)